MKVRKELGKLDVVSVAFGAIIGWGCFVLPGNTFLPKAGPGGTAIGITLGAILVLLISQSYGYLIQKLPGSGGEYTYITHMFGKTHGFIAAWFLVLAYAMIIPLNATAVGLLLRTFLPDVASFAPLYTVSAWTVCLGELIPSFLAIVFVAIINVRGVKGAGWMQTVVSLMLIATVLLVTAMCMLSPQCSFSYLAPAFKSEHMADWGAEILSIVSVSAWAFMGFDCIPQMSDEYNFPHKQSRLLMYLSVILAALMYIAVNTITALAMPWKDLVARQSNWATGDAVAYLTGNIGLAILAVAMLCAIISGLNGFFMSSTRLVKALAEEKALPACFASQHKTHATPIGAIYFVAGLSVVAILFGRAILTLIVDMASVGTSFVFLYSTLAAVRYAKREGNYLQMWRSVLGAGCALFLLILLVVPTMPGYIGDVALQLMVLWAAVGAVFYCINRKRYLEL